MAIAMVIRKRCFPYCECHNFIDGTCQDDGLVFLSKESNFIYKYDKNNNYVVYKSVKVFISICYNCLDKCYYAVAKDEYDYIYKLNKEFIVIRKVALKYNCLKINKISYCKDKDILILVTNNCVIGSDTNGECSIIKACEYIREAYYSAYLFKDCKYILLDGTINKKLLIYANNETCLYKFNKYTIPIDIICVENNRNCKGIILQVLVKNICTKEICLIDIYVSMLCCFKRKEVARKCKNDLLCSIALMETSLSHILNAEGEKLKQGIKLAENIDELLKLNDNISATITNVSHLEYLLLNKLRMALKNDDKKEECMK